MSHEASTTMICKPVLKAMIDSFVSVSKLREKGTLSTASCDWFVPSKDLLKTILELSPKPRAVIAIAGGYG